MARFGNWRRTFAVIGAACTALLAQGCTRTTPPTSTTKATSLVPSAPAAAEIPTGPHRTSRGGGANSADYPYPYRAVTPEQISAVLDRVFAYVDANTPSRIVSTSTGAEITDFSAPNPDAGLPRTAYPLISYEWGVTYSGMLLAADGTGQSKYRDYVDKRLTLISNLMKVTPASLRNPPPATGPAEGERNPANNGARPGTSEGRGWNNDLPPGESPPSGDAAPTSRPTRDRGSPLRPMYNPRSLDDSGSMAAALIKARLAKVGPDLLPQIDRYLTWISTGQLRLPDGTLARNRPHPNSLWLDDLYMSVPALANMGRLTGEQRYYDDACRQVLQFAQRMFVRDKGLFAHGWTASAQEHPAFFWGRANGWAIVAMTELLEVLPEDHPQRPAILELYKSHIRGLALVQGGEGLWHQVLDRNDSYLETSCTAMFTFAIARGVNRGWLDPITYGPVAFLGWNALATRVNAQGQVEGTCVATDMAFDYGFYYYRPFSATAPHGFGPVLLAGGEMSRLAKNHKFKVAFASLQLAPPPPPLAKP